MEAWAKALRIILRVQEFHIQAETTDFLHQNIEGFRNARFEVIFTFNDAFIDFRPPCNVIRFDRQHFLQCVSRAVSFQSPNLHFTKALAAKLGFTTQWLLRDQAVGPS